MGFLVVCIQESSTQLLCLNFSSTLLDFSSVIQQGSSSLEEVCPLWLIWMASWFSLELMFSRTTWHWPWGSSFVSVLQQQAYSTPEWQDNFQPKKFSRQEYLMLLAQGLSDTARLNSLQGQVRIPFLLPEGLAIASGVSSRTFWCLFNTLFGKV